MLDRVDDLRPLGLVLFLVQEASVPKFLELPELGGWITPCLRRSRAKEPVSALNCTACFRASRTAVLPSSPTVCTVPSLKMTMASAVSLRASGAVAIGMTIALPQLNAEVPSVTLASAPASRPSSRELLVFVKDAM
jgi:hypothetical protein